jgi:hypothetical protein
MEVSVPRQWSLYLWWKCLYQASGSLYLWWKCLYKASGHSTCDGSVCTKPVITLLVMEVSVPSQWVTLPVMEVSVPSQWSLLVMEVSVPSQWSLYLWWKCLYQASGSLYLWWKCLYQASNHSTCDGSVCTKPVVTLLVMEVSVPSQWSLYLSCICVLEVSICLCLELYNFSIRFCNCSDSVVFIFYHFITSLGLDCRLCTSSTGTHCRKT